MIFRKPYAFLVKNFKKIHIFMLFLCAYIFYKCIQTRSFVSEFVTLGSYDINSEPISRHINLILILGLLIVIGLSVALLVLLKRKNKPWKLYLVPIIVYSAMFLMFIITSNFFSNYRGEGTTGVRAIRDLLLIVSLGQYPVFIILLIRIFGIDINNFNFKIDQEYLELDSGDREEFEVNIDIDKHTFIRGYKRFLRNIGYVYQEHKFLSNVLITLVIGIFLVTSFYNIFILRRSYKQGDVFELNGYTLNIKNSYYTDKNYNGKVISKTSNFVIVSMNIKNNVYRRDINFKRFHVMNGVNDYTDTYRTYESDFSDLGVTYSEKEFKSGENIDLIMVFKVDKKLPKDKFVLYYQDYINNKPFLRKIKLNMEDVSKIVDMKPIKKGHKAVIDVGPNKKDLTIESVKFVDKAEYNYEECDDEELCAPATDFVSSNNDSKILKIDFVSDAFEGKELIDFSAKYGKINYIDSKDKDRSIKIKDAIGRKYMGQYMYIRVPKELSESKNMKMVYTVRNKKYTFELK